jgi:hypothetical protein
MLFTKTFAVAKVFFWYTLKITYMVPELELGFIIYSICKHQCRLLFQHTINVSLTIINGIYTIYRITNYSHRILISEYEHFNNGTAIELLVQQV